MTLGIVPRPIEQSGIGVVKKPDVELWGDRGVVGIHAYITAHALAPNLRNRIRTLTHIRTRANPLHQAVRTFANDAQNGFGSGDPAQVVPFPGPDGDEAEQI